MTMSSFGCQAYRCALRLTSNAASRPSETVEKIAAFPKQFHPWKDQACFAVSSYPHCLSHLARPFPACQEQCNPRCASQSLRALSNVPRQSGGKPGDDSLSTTEQQPSEEASQNNRGHSTSQETRPYGGAAGGLGIVGMLGYFGKRFILILGGKKALGGLLSIVALKKFLFVPGWVVFAVLTGGASLSMWWTQRKAPVTGRPQTIWVTQRAEAEIGSTALKALKDDGLRFLESEHSLVQRLRRIGETLKYSLAALDPHPDAFEWLGHSWTFDVSVKGNNSEGMLAFAVQPAHVVVSERLLCMLKSDDQVAFVIAHEMGHIIARHSAEAMTRTAFWNRVVGLMYHLLGIELWEHTARLYTSLPYDRQMEYEADYIATVLLSKACYNIDAGVEALSILKSGPFRVEHPNWLQHWSTHPNIEARISSIRSHLPALLHASPCHYEADLRAALRMT